MVGKRACRAQVAKPFAKGNPNRGFAQPDELQRGRTAALASNRWLSLLQRARDAVPAVKALLRSARSISFSQFGEDLLLAVSLRPRSRGFYVDVGAYHPWNCSNTYKLYLRGWSGLTIEPDPEAARLFQRWRPRDRHLTEAVARNAGTLDYHEFRDRKLNTFSSSVAAYYREVGKPLVSQRPVHCRPLQDIVDEHARDTQIDLLSIDCEGLDYEVLQTVDFERNRPVVILIEDFEEFSLQQRIGGEKSAIRRHLEERGYHLIGHGLFSMLYLDARAREEGRATAFGVDHWQFT